jgi:adenylate cyclase
MRRRRLRLLLLFAVGLLAGGIGVLAYATNALRTIENDSVDARFSIRGDRKPPPNIVIVGVDDSTIQHLNLQWPYPRSLHAKVIERLHSLGAKAIAVDILFDLPENAPKKPCDFAGIDLAPGDCALLVATGDAGNVIYSEVEAGPGGITPFVGQKGGASALKALGATPAFTGISDDPSTSKRRFLYGFSAHDGGGPPYYLQSFAVVAAEKTNGRKVTPSIFNPSGTAWINYYGGPGTFPLVPYWKVAQNKLPPGYFKGKTVVLGAYDSSLKDVFSTPTGGSQLMAGPEIQANAIATVLRRNPLRAIDGVWNILLIIGLGLAAPLSAVLLRLRGLLVSLAAAVAFVIAVQIAFDNGTIVSFVYPLVAFLIGFVGALVVQYFTETRERLRVHSLFARFVPENVVGEVLERTDDDLRIGGVQREGTVMFSDLRGFTSFAESLPVERVIEVLNRYLGEMSEAILNNGGTLVAYMGDGIMAVFGAPIEQPDHADRGVAAAREMLGPRLQRFNDWLRAESLSEGFRMGVGLNSGPVMSGNVGSERRLEYTAIGDTTNTASRIEGMTKGTPHQLFVSDATRSLLKNPVEELFFVGEFEVRGRQQKIRLWSLPEDGAAPSTGAPVGVGSQTPTSEGDGE